MYVLKVDNLMLGVILLSIKLSDELIDEITSSNDIVDVISQYIQLKKSGKNYKALCPFHSEKTPSFIVSEEKQLYHCFGCGAAGNNINFIMSIENLDFIDAILLLAERANIDISKYNTNIVSNGIKNKELFNINREAAIYFYNNLLRRKDKTNYLLQRGLNRDIIKKFGLGYAIDAWEDLNNYLLKKDFSQELIYQAGLVVKRKDNKGYYDRFRNRIIFPIFNVTNKVVGFGGRVVDDSNPKYLNSPESEIFNKSSILYGLNFAKKELSKQKRLILVEGYTDVISLYQYDIKNVVATLGTALTKKHAEILKRYCEEVIITYDSDKAGEAATLRGLDILDEVGCKVKVVRLEKNMDPDEYIRNEGVEQFKNKIETALPLIDYRIELTKNNYDINTNEGKINFIKNTIDILKEIKSPVELDVYITKLSKESGISENVIKAEIHGNNRDKNYNNSSFRSRNYTKENIINLNSIKPVKKLEKNELFEIEKSILNLCLIDKNIFNKISSLISADDFSNDDLKYLYEFIFKTYKINDKIDKDYLLENLDIIRVEIITEILGKVIPYEDIDKTISELVISIRKNKIKKEIIDVKEKIKTLEMKELKSERDVKSIKELCGELIKLEKQMMEVK